MLREKWCKPECLKVRLVPQEAVLWGCKLAFGATGQAFLTTCLNIFANCPRPAS